MSDPLDPTTIGTHGGVGLIAAAVTAGVARFFAGKEAKDVAIELALLKQSMQSVADEVKHLRERAHEQGNNIARLLWHAGIDAPQRRDTKP